MSGTEKYIVRFDIEWDPVPAYIWAGTGRALEKFGYGPIQDDLPLPDELRERGAALARWYQGALNWDYPPDPGLWRQEECDRFKVAARAFYKDLQAALGDAFEVLYHQDEPDEHPRLDEYLADPKNFRRSR